MKIEQKKFTKEGWETLLSKNGFDALSCSLVIAFGSTEIINDPGLYKNIQSNYPNADILMNSTAGEIYDTQVNDNTISLTAIQFDKTKIKTAVAQIGNLKNSFDAGRSLAAGLDPAGLKNVFVISDGLKVNGSELVLGLQKFLPKGVIITGGLAGDGAKFKTTLVGLNESPIEGRIVAVGFYGNNLSVTYGSVGGWDSFGPERLITKSRENVLYELDYQPALDIYKKYLGEYANELPSSGLLFPLSIRKQDADDAIVRTILAVNEEEKSLTFAGNMPQENYARLMKANFDRLIEGACNAAQNSIDTILKKPDLAILISCVGRKLLLNQRIEEEVEEIREVYGDSTALTGFYSYGEISPSNLMKCELHNQTMTITTFTEE
ncbi:MAG TPA: FIST N-terminal domain-containing protein [Chitinophagaceae bacterium]|nr:FIST N-terminal domain-containing protein [Chitinophagaceae bacterium]